MIQMDLLGDPIDKSAAMRKSSRRKGGYAARPGTGPKGQRCNTCAHFTEVSGGGRSFIRCRLMSHAWTYGPATDIKPRAPACVQWERKPRKPMMWGTVPDDI